MYDHLPLTPSSKQARYILGSPKPRLGQKGDLYGLFCIPPLANFIVIFFGWLWLGFRFTGAAYWSPLSPVDMAIAGIAVPATSTAKSTFQSLASAPIDWDRENKRLRLAVVQPDRLGLSINAKDVDPKPLKGCWYGAGSSTAQSPAIVFDPKLYSPQSGTTVSPYSNLSPGQTTYNSYFSSVPVVPSMAYTQGQPHV
jgi:hypothetical protein